jgi:hypothetical protein
MRPRAIGSAGNSTAKTCTNVDTRPNRDREGVVLNARDQRKSASHPQPVTNQLSLKTKPLTLDFGRPVLFFVLFSRQANTYGKTPRLLRL